MSIWAESCIQIASSHNLTFGDLLLIKFVINDEINFVDRSLDVFSGEIQVSHESASGRRFATNLDDNTPVSQQVFFSFRYL